jgi:hypothetical protein
MRETGSIPQVAEKQPPPLRAIAEIRGGELCIYPLCDNDLDEQQVLAALRLAYQVTD